ncbi:MAG: 2Fe-2S iron-sulfur cluster binding domain-containing protein [Deltaproteobacteria bacterium]|nr:2Fe-2S iron-sulfur cluster binding domain-containing protein [Deltaproteobacteria bacterium]
MTESIEFHTDLYRRDALQMVAAKYRGNASIELADSGPYVVARVAPFADGAPEALCDEFRTEAFSATARTLRDAPARGPERSAPSDEPPWALLHPLVEGANLALGWALESLGPVRGGATTMTLRHEQHGPARVTIRRNAGAPLGVAHTDHLDFLLMNGGKGTSETEPSVGRVLQAVARLLETCEPDAEVLAALLPHREAPAAPAARAGAGTPTTPDAIGRIAPHIDPDARTISFDFDETGVSRLTLYDAILTFTDRCYVALTRLDASRIGVRLKARGDTSTDALRALTRDVVKTLNHLRRTAVAGDGPTTPERYAGLTPLHRRAVDVAALLAELDAADPATLGVGFEPERGPGHENLRIMNILGTGACNSDCLFCCEKFNPGNRLMPTTDATRQAILDGAGQFDMLFFASGEPTIHPKLFEHVELAKTVGFSAFGMSSHFRTFADPRFALKVLQAGFEYFDISLHAADPAGQLAVNPIGDDGASLFEALKGLAVIYRLADALGIRVSITQKIVVSRLNVLELEPIFRATYERGVRNFILQPVRALGLASDRHDALAISEDEILPHLNEFLRATEGLGAEIKPYGFSRLGLFTGAHVVHEQNRVKNVMGKHKQAQTPLGLPESAEDRPTDDRFWIEVRTPLDERFAFAADGEAPVLDVALGRGARLPFGCRMGSCGMCCARLLEGSVDQSTQIFLTEEQARQGYVLLCQARPRSDAVLMMCTDDEIDKL